MGRPFGRPADPGALHTFPTARAVRRDLELNSTTSLNMPRSRSRLEREDPPPRRKSCRACVKAKRRCDQRQPACVRCSSRGIACHYPARPAPREGPPSDPLPATPPTAFGPGVLPDGAGVDDTLMSFFGLPHDTESLGNTWPGQKSPCQQRPELAWAPGVNLDYSQVADTPSLALAIDDGDVVGDETVGNGFVFDLTYNTPTGLDVAVRTPLGDPAPKRLDLAALHVALQDNLSYALERIKEAPTRMLLENQTPWCHPLLYREKMPRAIQEAVSACALHASKNAVNTRVILRCIETKVDDLVGSTPRAEPLDALARTQALLLYQTIRFFDGDVLARSSADATFVGCRRFPSKVGSPAVSDNTDGLSLFQSSQESWKAWVFQESARRTFLVASFFVHMWELLTGRAPAECRRDEALLRQCWTLSAHLWEAGNALDFAAAWRDRKHYVVRRDTIRSTLMDAEAGDLESFGKMLLTTALGVDGAKAWLALRG
ncbi:hypothetical protein diail_4335 [Diaporthe ilicicola]|nr:hypothetical protein diail_4335 [Diaporthe ilicicola]